MNVAAGFWRRFFSALIDLFVLSTLVTILSFSYIDFNKQQFRNDYVFYLWVLQIIFVIILIKIIIPSITNGYSIGSKIFKTRIIFQENENKIYSMIKREAMFSISWIVILLLIGVLINHTLIIEYLKSNDWKTLGLLDQTRIHIITSFGGLVTFGQLIFIMTLIANPNKESIYDKISETKVVITNKFVKEEKQKVVSIIKPTKVKKEEIIWEENNG